MRKPSGICLLAWVLSGCVGTLGDLAIHRASNEFSCPAERIGIIQRSDIDRGLFDVEACGQRARYACFATRHTRHCVREPDPPRWLPDPKDVATLPQPPGVRPDIRSTPGPARMVCSRVPPAADCEPEHWGGGCSPKPISCLAPPDADRSRDPGPPAATPN